MYVLQLSALPKIFCQFLFFFLKEHILGETVLSSKINNAFQDHSDNEAMLLIVSQTLIPTEEAEVFSLYCNEN